MARAAANTALLGIVSLVTATVRRALARHLHGRALRHVADVRPRRVARVRVAASAHHVAGVRFHCGSNRAGFRPAAWCRRRRAIRAGRPGSLDVLWHLPLPVLALSLPMAATFERLQSQSMAEAVHQPFVLAAIARGVSARRALLRHAWPSSVRPICAVYGLAIGALLSGSFIVEFVTAWPGLGRLTFEALRARDVYLVAACAATGAAFLALGTMAGISCSRPPIHGSGRSKPDEARGVVAASADRARRAWCAVALAQSTQSTVRRSALRAADTRPRVAGWRAAPFIHPLRMVSRFERRFEADPSRRVTLRWFTDRCARHRPIQTPVRRSCCSAPTATAATSSRACFTAHGPRWLSRSCRRCWRRCSAPCVGGVAGYVGGWFDGVLSRVSEFVLVLAGDLRCAGAARRAAAGPATVHGLHAPDRHLYASRVADRRSRRARDRARRARARIRTWPHVRPAPATAACCCAICCRHHAAF